MDLTLIKIIVFLFWAVLTGLLAKRKNLNPWLWGVAGALSWFIAIIFLMFMPYKCPKCRKSITNDEGREGTCSFCDGINISGDNDFIDLSNE